jgi:hypothetical protein
MKLIRKFVKYFLLLPLLIIQFSCSDDTASSSTPGVLEGTWTLTALSGTYVRDVAQPAGSTTTSYNVTVSWDDALAVLGSATAADQTIANFAVGENVLTKTSELADTTALSASGVAMIGTFNSQNVYTLIGMYPTLRLNVVGDADYLTTDPATGLPLDDCETYQTVAGITDQGYYGVAYTDDNTGGTLTITPDASLGDQVLPPFDDATVTFTNEGNTVKIEFTDRDSHDARYTEVMDADEWTEEGNRVTMGIAVAGVDADGAFAATDAVGTNKSGYLKDAALAPWSYFLTWNALQYNVCVTTDTAGGGDGSSCATSHAAYLADDDSGDVFTIDCYSDFTGANLDALADCSGKLTYTINPVCIPVNEIIEFDADFDKVTD